MKKSVEPLEEAPARSAGRPRSASARRAVLDAACAILAEAGLAAFTIEAVADRSGVARTTIYRSWPTRGRLAMESFLEAFQPRLAYAETADPVADFRSLLASLVDVLSGPLGLVAASVIAEAQSDVELQDAFLEAFSKPLRRQSGRILERGIAQGVLRPDLDVSTVLDAAVGGVYIRLLLGQSLDPLWAGTLASTILRGCLAPE